MKFSVLTYSLVAVLSLITLTGFTCSKHVPEKAPEVQSESTGENSVPQDQMTDQTTSGDVTPATN